MVVLAATARLALTIARLRRRIGATRPRVETTLVLSRRAALRRRVRMKIVRARTVLTRIRRGAISIRQRLRARRHRGPSSRPTGLMIVRRHGSLVRRVHLVRQAHLLRVRVVHHNGRLRLRPSAMRARHLHAAKVRHLHGGRVLPRHSAKVLLRRGGRVRHLRNGRKLLRSINRASENQRIVFRGQWLVLALAAFFWLIESVRRGERPVAAIQRVNRRGR